MGKIDFAGARFELSAASGEGLPRSGLPEVCFCGRSNCGKSSLINGLTGRRGLAFVGSSPGKTRLANFYRAGECRLVDLPGYGYAKVPPAEKARWAALAESYFFTERNIKLAVLVLDIRREPSDGDRDMLRLVERVGCPFLAVLTKTDKLSSAAAPGRRAAIESGMGLPARTAYRGARLFSSKGGYGAGEIRADIERILGG